MLHKTHWDVQLWSVCIHIWYICLRVRMVFFPYYFWHKRKSSSNFILFPWKEISSSHSWGCFSLLGSWESSGVSLFLGGDGMVAFPPCGPLWSKIVWSLLSPWGTLRAAGWVCFHLLDRSSLLELEFHWQGFPLPRVL